MWFFYKKNTRVKIIFSIKLPLSFFMYIQGDQKQHANEMSKNLQKKNKYL